MKIICLEEHVATPGIIAAWRGLDPATRDPATDLSTGNEEERRLLDHGDLRIAAVDAAGVDVAVLSHTTPGVQSLPPTQAVPLARKANDMIAGIVRRRSDRLQGLATLPTPEAARELERAIVDLGLDGAMLFGRTGDRNLDHPDFRPILKPRRLCALRSPSTRRRPRQQSEPPTTTVPARPSAPASPPAVSVGITRAVCRSFG